MDMVLITKVADMVVISGHSHLRIAIGIGEENCTARGAYLFLLFKFADGSRN